MIWWEVLSIDKDADLKTIKRAYAKLIKEIDSVQDPDKFMEVRNAYEQGMSNLESYNVPTYDDYHDTSKVIQQETETITTNKVESHTDQLLEKMNSMYNDLNNRITTKGWMDFLSGLGYEEESIVFNLAFNYFEENYVLMPKVWLFLKEYFPFMGEQYFKWHFIVNGDFTPELREDEQNINELIEQLNFQYDIYAAYLYGNKSINDKLNEYSKIYGDTKGILRIRLITAFLQNNYDLCDETIKILRTFEDEEWHCKYYETLIANKRKDWKKAAVLAAEAKDLYNSVYTKFTDEIAINTWKVWLPWVFVAENPLFSINTDFELNWSPIYRRFFLKRGFYAMTETIDFFAEGLFVLLSIAMLIAAPFIIVGWNLITLPFVGVSKLIKNNIKKMERL